MPKHRNDTYAVDVPARPDLASIEDALESLSDLAARRDALRLMAERATTEADRLTKEIATTFASHKRELESLLIRLA